MPATDVNKSPGPNEWHLRFIKEFAAQPVVPLQVLFRKYFVYIIIYILPFRLKRSLYSNRTLNS